MIGNCGPIATLYQIKLLDQKKYVWREPFFILGIFMQFLCVILFVCFIIDRKRIITEQGGGSKWNNWFIPRDVLREKTIAVHSNTSSTNGLTTQINEVGETKIALPPIENLSFSKRMLHALSNPYNYLFAVLYSLIVIPHIILGGCWLKKYLMLKFIQINMHRAQLIVVLTFIGGAIGCLSFGFIETKFRDRCSYIHRILCCAGFILSSCVLFIIYVPAEYYGEWDVILLIFAFLHGFGLGVVPIVFSATRQLNDANKSADFASGLVQTFGVAAVSVSLCVIGKLMHVLIREKNVSEYNQVFYFVAACQIVGLIASCFVPPKRYL